MDAFSASMETAPTFDMVGTDLQRLRESFEKRRQAWGTFHQAAPSHGDWPHHCKVCAGAEATANPIRPCDRHKVYCYML